MTYEKDYRKRILNFYYENGKTKTLFQVQHKFQHINLRSKQEIFHQEHGKENLRYLILKNLMNI